LASSDVSDFVLGITDNYLDGDPRAAKKLNNLVINENNKLVQHPGLTIYNSSAPQLPPGNQSVDSLYYFDSTLFAKSGARLYLIKDGDSSWTTLAGPTGNDAFADSELGAKCSWSESRGHLFITPGPSTNKKGGCRTVKVYRNAANTWYLVQAGLPRYKDATGGVSVESDVIGTNVVYFRYLVMSMFTRTYVAKINGVDTTFRDFGQPVVFADRDNVTTGTNIDYAGSESYVNKTNENFDTTGLRLDTFRTKADGTEFYIAVSQRQATGPHPSDSTLGTIQAKCSVQSSASAASGLHTMHVADIAFFYVGQKVTLDDGDSSAVTRYVRTVSYTTNVVGLSATLGGAASNDSAYTTAQSSYITFDYSADSPSGYAEGNYNDPTPPCYFSSIVDGYGWYAAPIDTSLTNRDAAHRATRVLQSKPTDPDGCPSGNYVDLAVDVLTAMGYFGQHPIACSRNKTYRIEGRLDAFGGGGLRGVLVSETEGAVCQEMIPTPFGLLFQSETGWCVTDGFQVTNLSKNHLRTTYSALSNKSKGSACFDALNQRAYFGTESAALTPAVSGKNNSAFVLDLKRSKGGENGVFTTISADDNFQPAALHYDSKNNRIIVGDSRGYVFKFDASKTTFPTVNTAVAYSTWGVSAIVWEWITCAFSFGSSRISKWMSEIWLVCKNLTGNLSIDFTSYKDDRTTGVRMKAARDRSITSGLHKIKRGFPKGNLSCVYAQLQIKKGFVVIARSDDYDQAAFNNAGNTALIASGVWPSDGTDAMVGHYLFPEIAGAYDTGWVISAHSGDTLTVSDPSNNLPTATSNWVIKGYPKAEGVEIHSLGIEHQVLGEGYPERSGQGGNT